MPTCKRIFVALQGLKISMLAKHAKISDRDAPILWMSTIITRAQKNALAGTFISTGSYMKILHSLMTDDEKLLRSNTFQIVSCFLFWGSDQVPMA